MRVSVNLAIPTHFDNLGDGDFDNPGAEDKGGKIRKIMILSDDEDQSMAVNPKVGVNAEPSTEDDDEDEDEDANEDETKDKDKDEKDEDQGQDEARKKNERRKNYICIDDDVPKGREIQQDEKEETVSEFDVEEAVLQLLDG